MVSCSYSRTHTYLPHGHIFIQEHSARTQLTCPFVRTCALNHLFSAYIRCFTVVQFMTEHPPLVHPSPTSSSSTCATLVINFCVCGCVCLTKYFIMCRTPYSLVCLAECLSGVLVFKRGSLSGSSIFFKGTSCSTERPWEISSLLWSRQSPRKMEQETVKAGTCLKDDHNARPATCFCFQGLDPQSI